MYQHSKSYRLMIHLSKSKANSICIDFPLVKKFTEIRILWKKYTIPVFFWFKVIWLGFHTPTRVSGYDLWSVVRKNACIIVCNTLIMRPNNMATSRNSNRGYKSHSYFSIGKLACFVWCMICMMHNLSMVYLL